MDADLPARQAGPSRPSQLDQMQGGRSVASGGYNQGKRPPNLTEDALEGREAERTMSQLATNQTTLPKSAGGILTQRMFLPCEDPQQFADLQDDLRLALRPMGVLELMLVEKIAMIIWRQRRLVAAESASIQLATSPGQSNVRHKVAEAMGDPGRVDAKELSPMTEEDNNQVEWCREAIREIEALPEKVDLKLLSKEAPHCYKQFLSEAQDEEVKPEIYLTALKSLAEWLGNLHTWCKKELEKYGKRERLKPFLQLVQIKEVAHVGLQLMNTFHASLDTELYRAMDALRKQQEWRQKNGIDLAVVAEE